jgi:membrane protein DedA with SNARE-associated domain
VTLAGFLMSYGGVVILPLAIVEGPIVSIITGVVCSQGVFAWYWAFCLLACGDLIGDLVYYWIGRGGGTPLAWLGARLGIRGEVSPELQRDLRRNAGKMWLIGKWTHSIGFLVLIGSGMLRLPLPRFVLVNLLATLPKTALLLGLGYFVGGNLPFFEDHAVATTVVLCFAGMTAMVAILRRTGRLWVRRGAP